MSLHYPEADHTPEVLDIIAEDWLNDLKSEHVNAEDFKHCINEARRRNTFFPKISDILKIIKEYHRSPAYQAHLDEMALPESPSYKSDVDLKRNKKCLAIMAKVISGELTATEGEHKCNQFLGINISLHHQK